MPGTGFWIKGDFCEVRMKKLVLYLHGKGGSAGESEHYRALFPGREVLGLDYRGETPWEAGAEILAAVERLQGEYDSIALVANSIGAWFAILSGIESRIDRAYFISPIVDMEKLIQNMMRMAGVTEAELEAQGVIETGNGETLRWDYLHDVREHPIRWNVPTAVLYGSGDELTDRETMAAFCEARGAALTVMEGGEHWFHTEAQMDFLDRWLLQSQEPLPVNGRKYRLLSLLGKGKGGYSYLAEGDGEQVVLKQIHHEPCDYYQFGNKLESEERDYGRLLAAGIRVPRMLDLDWEKERIVKEYIQGPTVMELVQQGLSAAPCLPQARDMAAQARAAGLNIDYYPTNFVLRAGKLWYVDYECNVYSRQWDFEHWGIRYWGPKAELRPYREQDYEAVCAFLIELNREEKSHIHWNWARFEWMMEHPEFDKASASAIGLWWAEDQVVGAAIYDMYFGEAFCAALPDWAHLYPEILDYAGRELRDEKGLGIALCEGSEEIRVAEAMGFAQAEQRENVMRISLDSVPEPELPEGFRLAELDPGEDVEDFQWLLWQGFDHGEDRTEFEREDPVTARRRPHFDPRLSLTAIAPEGEKAAYCCLWYHPDTDYAYVEPVCTVPRYRGRGIAGALLREGLKRARSLGAKEAYVISDLGFYESLGFATAQRYRFWWKA